MQTLRIQPGARATLVPPFKKARLFQIPDEETQAPPATLYTKQIGQDLIYFNEDADLLTAQYDDLPTGAHDAIIGEQPDAPDIKTPQFIAMRPPAEEYTLSESERAIALLDHGASLGAVSTGLPFTQIAFGSLIAATSVGVVTHSNKATAPTTPPATPTLKVFETAFGLEATGQADPGELVTVRFADGTEETVVADSTGHYTAFARTAQAAEGTVEVFGRNSAGVSDGLEVSYIIAPITDVVTPNPDGTLTVTGTTTYPNTTVIITYPDQTQSRVTADANGLFTAKSLVAQNSGVVSVIGTNEIGDQSLPFNSIYVDQFPPVAPTLTAVLGGADGRLTIQGYAEAGSTVTITLPSNRIVTATADPITGFFSLVSMDTEHNGPVSVFSIDTVGNISPTKTTTYIDQTIPAPPEELNATTNPDGTINLEGSAVPDTTVVITFPNGATASVTVDSSGHFAIRSVDQQPSGTISIITQLNGNPSAAATVEYTDITSPPGPTATFTSATDGTLTIQGTAEPGCTVTVQLPDGSLIQSAVVGANGLYSMSSPTPQANGILQIYATDVGANRSVVESEQYEYSAIPNTPVIQTVTSNPNGTVQVIGTAIPGSQLTIQFPDGSAPANPIIADTTGHFSAVSQTPQANTNLSIGSESILVFATFTDASSLTAQHTYTDITLPQAAVLQAPTVNADGSLTITGSAEPYSTVQIQFPDGTTQSVLTNALGNFTSQPSALAQTSGTMQATVTDLNGLSAAQPETRAYVDTHIPLAPTLQFTPSPSGNGHLTVSGKSEPNSTVTITPPGGAPVQVTADAQGAYTWTSTTPIVNGNVQVTTTTAAGHSAATPAVESYVNSVPPTAPTIATAVGNGDGTVTVSGTAVPGSTVQLRLADGTLLGTQTADAAGHYSIPSTLQVLSASLNVVADFTGLSSSPTVQAGYTYQGTTNAPILTVTPLLNGTLIVSGTAPANSVVSITFANNNQTITAQANANGQFTSAPSALPQPTSTVTATAKLGSSGLTSASTPFAYTDTQVPEEPVINNPTVGGSNVITVTGTAEPGTTVVLTYPDGSSTPARGQLGAIVADPVTGAFTATSPANQPAGVVTGVSVDAVGSSAVATSGISAIPTITLTPNTGNGKLTVSGTTEPNASIQIKFPDGTTTTVTANGGGAYSAQSAAKQYSGNAIVTVTDLANNVGQATGSYLNTVAPTVSGVTTVVNPNGTMTVSGVTEPGAVVAGTFLDNASNPTLNFSKTADVAGHFSYTTPLPQVSGTLQLAATDLNGNASAPQNSAVTAATPQPPIITQALFESNGTLIVNGTAQPLSTVVVTFADGSTSAPVTANENGQFSAALSASAQLNGGITATAAFSSLTSAASSAFSAVSTTLPDSPTLGAPVANANGTVTVSGTAIAGSTVNVRFPAPIGLVPIVADNTGHFSISSPTLLGGVPSGKITATTTWNALSSPAGSEATVTYTDATPPAMTVNAPSAIVASGKMQITGTAEIGSVVKLVLADGSSVSTTVDATGVYTLTSPGVAISTGYTVFVTDRSGLEVQQAGTFNATLPPLAPTLDGTVIANLDGTLTLNGHAQPKSTVQVTFPGGIVKQAIADADGVFVVVSTAPIILSGNISVTATDVLNHTSPAATTPFTLALPTETVKIVAMGKDTVSSFGTLGIGTATDFKTNEGSAGRGVFGTINQPLKPGETLQASFDGGSTWQSANLNKTYWDTTDLNAHTANWTLAARVINGDGLPGPVATQLVTLNTAIPIAPTLTDAQPTSATVSLAGTNATSGSLVHLVWGNATQDYLLTSANITAGTVTIPIKAAVIAAQGGIAAFNASAQIIDPKGQISLPSAPIFIPAGVTVDFSGFPQGTTTGTISNSQISIASTGGNITFTKFYSPSELSVNSSGGSPAQIYTIRFPQPVNQFSLDVYAADSKDPINIYDTNGALLISTSVDLYKTSGLGGTKSFFSYTAPSGQHIGSFTAGSIGGDWWLLNNIHYEITAAAAVAAAAAGPIIVGPPSASLFGTAGSDAFSITDLSYFSTLGAHLDGGAGVDTLSFSVKNKIFDLTALPGTASHPVLNSIEKFDLGVAGTNTLKLSINEVLHLGQTDLFNPASGWTGAALAASGGHVNRVQLVIDGDATDTVTLLSPNPAVSDGGSWQLQSGQASFNSQAYSVYHHSTELAQLLIQQSIPVQIL